MSDIRIVGGSDASGSRTDVSIVEGRISRRSAELATIDASGLTVAPGFIDIQINGAYGFDFTEDPSSIWDVGKRLPEQGVTSFCPTIITSAPDRVPAAQAAATIRPAGYIGAEPIGLHVEGPYLSREKRGTHPIEFLHESMPDNFDTSGVAIMTVAPELPGAVEFIQRLVESGVVVSLGHSAATAAQTTAAIDAGASMGTHLFNAMPPMTAREPGLAGVLLTNPSVWPGVIVDGVHVADEMLRVAWSLASDRLILITDSISATGMPEGSYAVAGIPVQVHDGAVRNDEGALAGSVLTMDRAVAILMEATGADFESAIASATSHPAQALGRSEIGSIVHGSRGDVVLLDGVEVITTVIAGHVAFCSQPDRLKGDNYVAEV
jgi:N-acetylglucosamine-6-phosphate deacetylase